MIFVTNFYMINPSDNSINIISKCPELQITLNNTEIVALVDSSSEITCISEQFFEENLDSFKNHPTLPIVGKIIKGATGLKSTKITKQVLINTKFNDFEFGIIYTVVLKLTRHCIIGYDTMKLLHMTIDSFANKITHEQRNL